MALFKVGPRSHGFLSILQCLWGFTYNPRCYKKIMEKISSEN